MIGVRSACIALVLAAAACGGGPLDDIAITAVKLESAPRLDFLRARNGMKFLAVSFELENRTGDILSIKALDFSMTDTQGRLYPFSAQVLDMGQDKGVATATIRHGERLPGRVVFQVPTAALPGSLIYRQDIEGGLEVRLLSSG